MATVIPPKTETKNGHTAVVRAPKKRPRKWLWPAIFIFALIVGGVVWAKTRGGGANTGLITAVVTRGDLTETVTATGSVEAQTGAQVHIGSQITGVVNHLYAVAGQDVKAGQLIATLDLPDLVDTYKGAQAAYSGAVTKYQQEQAGVTQEKVTTQQAIDAAKATLVSKQQELLAAQEALNQQKVGTPSDIKKAQTALATAKATLVQTQAGYNLQIATANEQLLQAQANAKNSSANLARTYTLYQQGYIAATTYDQAVATDKVNQSLVSAAQQNVDLTKQKEVADLDTANQAVASAQAALDAANAETLTTAQREANVKDAQAAVDAAVAALKTAQANTANDIQKLQDVEQAQDAAKTALDTQQYDAVQVSKTEIRTPISGTILSNSIYQGETVAAGLAAPTLVTVADLDKLEVEDYVSEEDIGKVKIGQPATVVVDAFPNQTFQGTVYQIYSGSTIQQNVVTYDVVIRLKNPGHMLKPDMTATVNITVGKLTNVVEVPAVAIQLTTNGSTVNVLRTVDGKQEIKAVPVVTGGTDGVNVEIKKGLNEGDKIVLAGGPSTSSRRGPTNPFGPSSSSSGGGGSGGR